MSGKEICKILERSELYFKILKLLNCFFFFIFFDLSSVKLIFCLSFDWFNGIVFTVLLFLDFYIQVYFSLFEPMMIEIEKERGMLLTPTIRLLLLKYYTKFAFLKEQKVIYIDWLILSLLIEPTIFCGCLAYLQRLGYLILYGF